MMGGLFCKDKPRTDSTERIEGPTRVTDQDRAVLQLKQQRDKVKQYQRRIGAMLEKERKVAQQLLKNNKKDKALLLLRKKKYQESLLEKTDGQLDNLDRLIHDIEFAQIEQQVLKGLDTGNQALKTMHALFSLEDVERIMDETADSLQYQNEIDALLAGNLTQQDESDVLEELDQIIAESLPNVQDDDINIRMPDVPAEDISAKILHKQKRENPVKVLSS